MGQLILMKGTLTKFNAKLTAVLLSTASVVLRLAIGEAMLRPAARERGRVLEKYIFNDIN